MILLAYFIFFVMGLVVIDHYSRKSADKALEDELAVELHEAFGHIRGPITLDMARHEAEMEALNGLMVEDDPDLNDPYRPD